MPIGKTFEALTGGTVTYFWGITIASLSIGLYVYFGGARAVVWTDMIQGFIFALLLITAGLLAVQWAGGWGAMIGTLTTQYAAKASFAGKVTWRYYEFGLLGINHRGGGCMLASAKECFNKNACATDKSRRGSHREWGCGRVLAVLLLAAIISLGWAESRPAAERVPSDLVAAEWQPPDWWRLHLAYTYQQIHLRIQGEPAPMDTQDEDIEGRSPRHSVDGISTKVQRGVYGKITRNF